MSNAIFFVHGGPGLNSYAEKGVLGPLFESAGVKTYFWNEPSLLRQDGDGFKEDGAYLNWVESLQKHLIQFYQERSQPIHLFAHSFAATACLSLVQKLAQKHPQLFASLTFIAPAFNLEETYKNILRLAVLDFKETNPYKADKLSVLLEEGCTFFDSAMEEGFEMAFTDELLLSHYWCDLSQLQKAVSFLTKPEAQIDLKSFFAVLRDFSNSTEGLAVRKKVAIPTLFVFGEKDPVVLESQTTEFIKNTFLNYKAMSCPNASHYVHLDNIQLFLENILPKDLPLNKSSGYSVELVSSQSSDPAEMPTS